MMARLKINTARDNVLKTGQKKTNHVEMSTSNGEAIETSSGTGPNKKFPVKFNFDEKGLRYEVYTEKLCSQDVHVVGTSAARGRRAVPTPQGGGSSRVQQRAPRKVPVPYEGQCDQDLANLPPAIKQKLLPLLRPGAKSSSEVQNSAPVQIENSSYIKPGKYVLPVKPGVLNVGEREILISLIKNSGDEKELSVNLGGTKYVVTKVPAQDKYIILIVGKQMRVAELSKTDVFGNVSKGTNVQGTKERQARLSHGAQTIHNGTSSNIGPSTPRSAYTAAGSKRQRGPVRGKRDTSVTEASPTDLPQAVREIFVKLEMQSRKSMQGVAVEYAGVTYVWDPPEGEADPTVCYVASDPDSDEEEEVVMEELVQEPLVVDEDVQKTIVLDKPDQEHIAVEETVEDPEVLTSESTKPVAIRLWVGDSYEDMILEGHIGESLDHEVITSIIDQSALAKESSADVIIQKGADEYVVKREELQVLDPSNAADTEQETKSVLPQETSAIPGTDTGTPKHSSDINQDQDPDLVVNIQPEEQVPECKPEEQEEREDTCPKKSMGASQESTTCSQESTTYNSLFSMIIQNPDALRMSRKNRQPLHPNQKSVVDICPANKEVCDMTSGDKPSTHCETQTQVEVHHPADESAHAIRNDSPDVSCGSDDDFPVKEDSSSGVWDTLYRDLMPSQTGSDCPLHPSGGSQIKRNSQSPLKTKSLQVNGSHTHGNDGIPESSTKCISPTKTRNNRSKSFSCEPNSKNGLLEDLSSPYDKVSKDRMRKPHRVTQEAGTPDMCTTEAETSAQMPCNNEHARRRRVTKSAKGTTNTNSEDVSLLVGSAGENEVIGNSPIQMAQISSQVNQKGGLASDSVLKDQKLNRRKGRKKKGPHKVIGTKIRNRGMAGNLRNSSSDVSDVKSIANCLQELDELVESNQNLEQGKTVETPSNEDGKEESKLGLGGKKAIRGRGRPRKLRRATGKLAGRGLDTSGEVPGESDSLMTSPRRAKMAQAPKQSDSEKTLSSQNKKSECDQNVQNPATVKRRGRPRKLKSPDVTQRRIDENHDRTEQSPTFQPRRSSPRRSPIYNNPSTDQRAGSAASIMKPTSPLKGDISDKPGAGKHGNQKNPDKSEIFRIDEMLKHDKKLETSHVFLEKIHIQAGLTISDKMNHKGDLLSPPMSSEMTAHQAEARQTNQVTSLNNLQKETDMQTDGGKGQTSHSEKETESVENESKDNTTGTGQSVSSEEILILLNALGQTLPTGMVDGEADTSTQDGTSSETVSSGGIPDNTNENVPTRGRPRKPGKKTKKQKRIQLQKLKQTVKLIADISRTETEKTEKEQGDVSEDVVRNMVLEDNCNGLSSDFSEEVVSSPDKKQVGDSKSQKELTKKGMGNSIQEDKGKMDMNPKQDDTNVDEAESDKGEGVMSKMMRRKSLRNQKRGETVEVDNIAAQTKMGEAGKEQGPTTNDVAHHLSQDLGLLSRRQDKNSVEWEVDQSVTTVVDNQLTVTIACGSSVPRHLKSSSCGLANDGREPAEIGGEHESNRVGEHPLTAKLVSPSEQLMPENQGEKKSRRQIFKAGSTRRNTNTIAGTANGSGNTDIESGEHIKQLLLGSESPLSGTKYVKDDKARKLAKESCIGTLQLINLPSLEPVQANQLPDDSPLKAAFPSKTNQLPDESPLKAALPSNTKTKQSAISKNLFESFNKLLPLVGTSKSHSEDPCDNIQEYEMKSAVNRQSRSKSKDRETGIVQANGTDHPAVRSRSRSQGRHLFREDIMTSLQLQSSDSNRASQQESVRNSRSRSREAPNMLTECGLLAESDNGKLDTSRPKSKERKCVQVTMISPLEDNVEVIRIAKNDRSQSDRIVAKRRRSKSADTKDLEKNVENQGQKANKASKLHEPDCELTGKTSPIGLDSSRRLRSQSSQGTDGCGPMLLETTIKPRSKSRDQKRDHVDGDVSKSAELPTDHMTEDTSIERTLMVNKQAEPSGQVLEPGTSSDRRSRSSILKRESCHVIAHVAKRKGKFLASPGNDQATESQDQIVGATPPAKKLRTEKEQDDNMDMTRPKEHCLPMDQEEEPVSNAVDGSKLGSDASPGQTTNSRPGSPPSSDVRHPPRAQISRQVSMDELSNISTHDCFPAEELLTIMKPCRVLLKPLEQEIHDCAINIRNLSAIMRELKTVNAKSTIRESYQRQKLGPKVHVLSESHIDLDQKAFGGSVMTQANIKGRKYMRKGNKFTKDNSPSTSEVVVIAPQVEGTVTETQEDVDLDKLSAFITSPPAGQKVVVERIADMESLKSLSFKVDEEKQPHVPIQSSSLGPSQAHAGLPTEKTGPEAAVPPVKQGSAPEVKEWVVCGQVCHPKDVAVPEDGPAEPAQEDAPVSSSGGCPSPTMPVLHPYYLPYPAKPLSVTMATEPPVRIPPPKHMPIKKSTGRPRKIIPRLKELAAPSPERPIVPEPSNTIVLHSSPPNPDNPFESPVLRIQMHVQPLQQEPYEDEQDIESDCEIETVENIEPDDGSYIGENMGSEEMENELDDKMHVNETCVSQAVSQHEEQGILHISPPLSVQRQLFTQSGAQTKSCTSLPLRTPPKVCRLNPIEGSSSLASRASPVRFFSVPATGNTPQAIRKFVSEIGTSPMSTPHSSPICKPYKTQSDVTKKTFVDIATSPMHIDLEPSPLNARPKYQSFLGLERSHQYAEAGTSPMNPMAVKSKPVIQAAPKEDPVFKVPKPPKRLSRGYIQPVYLVYDDEGNLVGTKPMESPEDTDKCGTQSESYGDLKDIDPVPEGLEEKLGMAEQKKGSYDCQQEFQTMTDREKVDPDYQNDQQTMRYIGSGGHHESGHHESGHHESGHHESGHLYQDEQLSMTPYTGHIQAEQTPLLEDLPAHRLPPHDTVQVDDSGILDITDQIVLAQQEDNVAEIPEGTESLLVVYDDGSCEQLPADRWDELQALLKGQTSALAPVHSRKTTKVSRPGSPAVSEAGSIHCEVDIEPNMADEDKEEILMIMNADGKTVVMEATESTDIQPTDTMVPPAKEAHDTPEWAAQKRRVPKRKRACSSARCKLHSMSDDATKEVAMTLLKMSQQHECSCDKEDDEVLDDDNAKTLVEGEDQFLPSNIPAIAGDIFNLSDGMLSEIVLDDNGEVTFGGNSPTTDDLVQTLLSLATDTNVLNEISEATVAGQPDDVAVSPKLTYTTRSIQEDMVAEETVTDQALDNCSYSCDVCPQSFSSMDDLAQHNTEHTAGLKIFGCHICNVSFPSKAALDGHMPKHTLHSQCFICSLSFESQSAYTTHMQYSHLGSLQCPMCREACDGGYSLNSHIYLNHTDIAVTNDMPGAVDTSYPIIQDNHLVDDSDNIVMETDDFVDIVVDSGDKWGLGSGPSSGLICKLCQQIFRNPTLLKHHLRLHVLGDNSVCSLCERLFSSRQAYVVHIYMHAQHSEAAKPHECKNCHQRFKTLEELSDHNSKQDLMLPYICRFCCTGFITIDELLAHIELHETNKSVLANEALKWDPKELESMADDKQSQKVAEIPPFTCPDCPVCFNTEAALKIHTQIHDRCGKHHCPICVRPWPTFADLATHILRHFKSSPFVCGECGRKHRSVADYKSHVDGHGGGFNCSTCDKSFTCQAALAAHTRIHAEEVQYVCSNCDSSFASKQKLTAHEKVCLDSVFTCEICSKEFNGILNLELHKKIHAVGGVEAKPYRCSVCQFSCLEVPIMKSHMLLHRYAVRDHDYMGLAGKGSKQPP